MSDAPGAGRPIGDPDLAATAVSPPLPAVGSPPVGSGSVGPSAAEPATRRRPAPGGVRGAEPGQPSRMGQAPSPRSSVGTATRPAPPSAPSRGPRRARLTVKRVDPWSVFKFSFVFCIAILVIWIVAVGALYGLLSAMGVFDKINSVLADFTTKNGVASWQLELTSSRVIGWAAVIGAVNAVLFTALATLGAFMYNLCSALSGGVEVTLTERD